jgi:hypothetical protein
MKPFDQAIYDEDDNAKHQIINWLERCGIVATVNEDKYGIDLVTPNGAGIEVEVKHNWVGRKFPYPEVHFSERKLKFAQPNTFFAMLNHDRDHVLITTGEAIFSSPRTKKRTKYTRWESFVEVPLSLCSVYSLARRTAKLDIK